MSGHPCQQDQKEDLNTGGRMMLSDVANMRITNWKDCIRNRPKWKEFVEKAKTSLKL